MKEIKRIEKELITELCKENDLNIDLVDRLFKEAKRLSYENVTLGARKKEYLDLITYYSKQDKGD
jgi:hypothetical protein